MKQKIIHKLFFLCLVILLGTTVTWAQKFDDSCNETIKKAEKEYKSGQFNKSIELINACKDNFSAQEVFESYRLLALSYINLNDEKNARKAAVNLLKSKPDYRDFPYFDPSTLTKMLSEYNVWPKIEVGLKVGLNINSVRPMINYTVTGSASEYLTSMGYQGGLTAEYFVKQKLSLNLNFLYEGLSYKKDADNVSGWSQKFKENLSFYNFPLTIRYYLMPREKLSIFAELGFQTQILSTTNSNVRLHNPVTNLNIQNTIVQKDQRNKTLIYGLLGLGMKYPVSMGSFIFDIRYAYGFNNVVNKDTRYDNMEFIASNQYVDSDFAFTPIYISAGFQFPLKGSYQVKLK